MKHYEADTLKAWTLSDDDIVGTCFAIMTYVDANVAQIKRETTIGDGKRYSRALLVLLKDEIDRRLR